MTVVNTTTSRDGLLVNPEPEGLGGEGVQPLVAQIACFLGYIILWTIIYYLTYFLTLYNYTFDKPENDLKDFFLGALKIFIKRPLPA